nr:MAG TPA: hypothetical protein [Microviridae sp.]
MYCYLVCCYYFRNVSYMTLHENDWITLVIRVVESVIDFFKGLLP